MARLRPALGRIAFALLSAAILLVFSEKLFWYVTGYGILDLLVGYFFPATILLAVVAAFRVRRPAAVFLAGAVFGFVAEGMLTSTLYEGGPLAWFSASYTPLAWHAPLSVFFGWWWLRRELIAGRAWRVALGGAAVGLLWGLWAMAWWLPENTADPTLLAQGARLGQWPVPAFALHAFTFTALLAVAHWLLGRGGWQKAFRPSLVEGVFVAGGLLVFFAALVLPAYPWAPLRLLVLVGVTLLGLYVNKRRERPGSALSDLAGPAQPRALVALVAMPTAAVAVYAAGAALEPSAAVIRAITAYGLVLGTAVLGWLAFVAALLLTLWPRLPSPPTTLQSRHDPHPERDTMTATLQDAIAAVRAGETGRAQMLTAEVIRDNPDDANAWYFLSQLVDSDARRAVYLHKAVALDPDNSRARAEFDALPAAAVASLSGAAAPIEAGGVEMEPVEIELVEADDTALTDAGLPAEALAESDATAAETAPEWLRPLSPEPAVAYESASAPVVAAVPPAAAQPRKTPPPPPARQRGNGALTALFVILLLLTLAVLAVLAYLLLL